MNTKQQPPLPTLQPGDSHMESLIEAAIQGHASTRDAMRWLVRQLVPHPSMATQAELTDAAIDAATRHIYHNGRPTSKEYRVGIARTILALRPERVAMTDEQIRSMCKQGWVFETVKQWVRIIEAHHGITAQAKKETP